MLKYNTLEEVKAAFMPVTNLAAEQTRAIDTVQKKVIELAQSIFDEVPEGQYRDIAMDHILTAKFAAVQGITHNWSSRQARRAS